MARCTWSECGRWRPAALARHGAVGVRCDGEWFCSRECLVRHAEARLARVHEEAPAVAAPPAPPLGHVLVRQHALTAAEIDSAVAEQRRTGRRLGEQLLAAGALSEEALLRALAAQACTGYLAHVDPARVEDGPGGLSREMVRALGLVPFEMSADGQRLAVAGVAPLRRASVLALREITGARVDAFIVSDAAWEGLARAYGTRAAMPGAPASATKLPSIGEAARRVAWAAAQGGAEKVRPVRCEPFTWVRLEGRGRREDLLVAATGAGEDRAWQAASTPH